MVRAVQARRLLKMARELLATEDEIFSFPAKMRRSEQLVKGYEATVRIVVVPTEKFLALSPEEKQDVTDELKEAITLRTVSSNRDGQCSANVKSGHLAQFFDIEVDDPGHWEYDNGEVTTLDTKYSRTLEEP